jgi:CHRD domain
MQRTLLTGISLLAGTALAISTAFAETVPLKADLRGAEEVPPVTTNATGKAEVSFDSTTKQLSWTVTFSGLSGDATAGHFHGPATPGQNAGVVVPFQNPVTSPVKGTASLTDAQAADLLAGRWYINIHTAANRGGEIRGQVVK